MDNIEKIIYEETEKRIEIMEKPDYQYPEQMKKSDYFGIVVGVLGSIALIVLCMIGVIS